MYRQRILLLIPHPDDEVVGCCAAIGRARARGGQVCGLYLTTGVPATEVLWPWQRYRYPARLARRQYEAKRAAQLLDIEIAGWQDIPTRRLKSHLRTSAAAIRRSIETTGAEILWTPAYEGGHQDHDTTNFLASRFRSRLPVWEFSEYHYAGGRVHSHEFTKIKGTEVSIDLEPAEQRRKQELLKTYSSERGNLGYVGLRREVFRPLADYDYTRPPHAGKLFYQRYEWVMFHPRIDYTKPDEVCKALREMQ